MQQYVSVGIVEDLFVVIVFYIQYSVGILLVGNNSGAPTYGLIEQV